MRPFVGGIKDGHTDGPDGRRGEVLIVPFLPASGSKPIAQADVALVWQEGYGYVSPPLDFQQHAYTFDGDVWRHQP